MSIPRLLRLPCRLMRLGIPQLRLRCGRGFRTVSSCPPSFGCTPFSELLPRESCELAESENGPFAVTWGRYCDGLSRPDMRSCRDVVSVATAVCFVTGTARCEQWREGWGTPPEPCLTSPGPLRVLVIPRDSVMHADAIYGSTSINTSGRGGVTVGCQYQISNLRWDNPRIVTGVRRGNKSSRTFAHF